jgi:NAD(P)-dependent dehydrogenase (short-subunit alcohol dehydrogenase family)
MSKTWFITGASRGFGKLWAQAALERGDRVAATARDTATLQELVDAHGDAILPIALDVNDREAGQQAVRDAHAHFGSLDVLINNAGYGHFGMIEELTEAEARAQIETNVFGALWITQAALPFMREQGSGHILQVSSIGGVAAFPGIGIYHASKWALEGFSEALSHEVKPFGIHVTLIEPSGYSTDWSGDSAFHSEANPAYAGAREAMAARRGGITPGDPEHTTAAILKVVDSGEPPLRLLLGEMAANVAPALYQHRLETWAAWDAVAREAQ